MEVIRVHRGGPAYRADIDGLRAIAVFSVVCYHAGLWPLRSGFVGVDIFFVISGFLIGGILDREIRGKRFSYSDFYARRARRILPALFGVTAFVCIAGLLLLGPRELRTAGLTGVGALLGGSNVYLWWSSNYFAAASHLNPLLMTWSLGVEEQFYVLFPLLLIMLARFRRRVTFGVVALMSLASFLLCLYVTARWPTAAFYLLPMRAWELGGGALLALWSVNARWVASQAVQHAIGTVGLAITLASLVIFTDATPFPGVAALMPVAGAAMLIYASESWVNRFILTLPPLVGIGLVSYSWYLWHAPMMAFARVIVFNEAGVGLLSLLGVVSLGLAYLSWRFIEQPFRHGTHGSGPALRRYAVALIAALILPLAFVGLHGLPQRLDAKGRAAEAAMADGSANPCLLPYGKSEPNRSPACLPGSAGLAVALLGDSHASALAPGIAALAKAQGLGLHQLMKSSCAPLINATREMAAHPQHARECAVFNAAAAQSVADDTSIRTVILAGYWGASYDDPGSRLLRADGGSAQNKDALLRDSLRATIMRYQAAGKRVIVLGDVPLLRFDPGKEATSASIPLRARLRAALGMPADAAGGRVAYRWVRQPTRGDEIVRDAVRAVPGAIYENLWDRLCDAQGCMDGADVPYYIDYQHLSAPGAVQATAQITF